MNIAETSRGRAFIRAAIDVAMHGEFEALRESFCGLSDEEAVPLGHAITEQLEEKARATGDWAIWARALHAIPRTGERAAWKAFGDRLAAWARPQRPKATDPGARQLARLALDLIRAGVPSGDVLHRLDDANATLGEPVSAERVGHIAIWAARAAGGSPVRAP